MAGEEKNPKVWPKEATEAADFTFMMVGNEDDPIMKIKKEKLNEIIVVQGESMPAIQGGTTAATAVALPAGPTGSNRWFDASWGYWKYNNVVLKNPLGTDGIPEGNDGTLYWDGTTLTWKISKMQILPMQQGVDNINPSGDALPKEKAVAIYVDDRTVKLTHGKNYYNPNGNKDNQLISNTGSISNATGWGWSGFVDITDVPVGESVTLNQPGTRLGVSLFNDSKVSTRYFAVTKGTWIKQIGENFIGWNRYSPTDAPATWGQVERGTVATAYEPFTKIIASSDVKNLDANIAATQTALEVSAENKTKLNSFNIQYILSKNHLNPALKVLDSVLNTGNGNWEPSSLYNGLAFTKVKALTKYNLLNSNNAPISFRQIVYYDINGNRIGASGTSTSTFTAPANTDQIQLTILKSTTEDFTSIGIFEDGNLWEPYALYKRVNQVDQFDTPLKNLDESATIKDVKNLIATGISSGLLYRIDSFGNMLMHDGQGNSISGQIANNRGSNGNNMFNFIQSAIKGITVGSSDDVAPLHILNTTIGANHGVTNYIATITGHGLDNTSIGKEFLKDGIKFYPMRIVDANRIAFISENSGTDASFIFTPLTVGTITSGSSSYTITAIASSQMYPSIGLTRLDTYINNSKAVLNTSGSASIIEVTEEYDIYNTSNVLSRAKARAGQTQDPDMIGDAACKVRNVYSFQKNFSCVITSEVLFKQAVQFTDIMGAQAVRIGLSPQYYLPNSLPIGGVDLRKPYQIPISPTNPSIYVSVNNNDPLNPPDRLIQYNGECGFMIGYLPGYNDYSKTARLFEIRGDSGKTYCHAVEGTKVGGTTAINDYYNIKIVRLYSDLSRSRKEGRMSYFICHEKGETFIWIDYSASMFDNLYIDIPELSGKKINVVQSKNTQLVSRTFNQGLIIKSTYVENETAFMVVKI